MSYVGMLMLGSFVGYIVTFSLLSVNDWSKPIPVLSGIVGAAAAGGLFPLIQGIAATGIGDAVYFYPVGLAYGALCTNMQGIGYDALTKTKRLHILAFTVATLLLLAVTFSETVREALPKPTKTLPEVTAAGSSTS